MAGWWLKPPNRCKLRRVGHYLFHVYEWRRVNLTWYSWRTIRASCRNHFDDWSPRDWSYAEYSVLVCLQFFFFHWLSSAIDNFKSYLRFLDASARGMLTCFVECFLVVDLFPSPFGKRLFNSCVNPDSPNKIRAVFQISFSYEIVHRLGVFQTAGILEQGKSCWPSVVELIASKSWWLVMAH